MKIAISNKIKLFTTISLAILGIFSFGFYEGSNRSTYNFTGYTSLKYTDVYPVPKIIAYSIDNLKGNFVLALAIYCSDYNYTKEYVLILNQTDGIGKFYRAGNSELNGFQIGGMVCYLPEPNHINDTSLSRQFNWTVIV